MITDIEVDWLGRWSLYSPDKVAIHDARTNKSFTYKQLYAAACGLSSYLKNLEVKPGDRVAVLSQNRIETVILFFALQRLGAILVPVNFRLSVPEITFILQDCGSKILFYEDAFKSTVENLVFNSNQSRKSKTSSQDETLISNSDHKNAKPPLFVISFDQERGLADKIASLMDSKVHADQDSTGLSEFLGQYDSPCMILYTSGTTGFPKGAVLTHKMLFWNAVNTSLSLNVTASDVTINFAPLFHTGGWNVLMTPFLNRGAKVIFFEKFDAQKVLQACESEKVTLLFGVPTMLSMMAESENFKTVNLESLRYMVVGGEPMPLALIKKWHEKGVPVRQGFGLTEFGPNCFSLSEKDAETKMGSIGRPNFYVRTKVVDSLGQEVAIGEVGELLLSGPCVMQGYWNNEKATEQAFTNEWFHTGDLVKKDQDHYFYVVGRKKEMFISGGENVYPIEVEKVLQAHPSVQEAAVIGVKDEKWGEVGHAFIALRNDLEKNDLIKFCKDHLAGFKIPKHFTFLENLPKGDSGKINKKSLNQQVSNLEITTQTTI